MHKKHETMGGYIYTSDLFRMLLPTVPSCLNSETPHITKPFIIVLLEGFVYTEESFKMLDIANTLEKMDQSMTSYACYMFTKSFDS